jgi:hypothetical protein
MYQSCQYTANLLIIPHILSQSLATLGPGIALDHVFALLVGSVLSLPRLALLAELIHFAGTDRAEFWIVCECAHFIHKGMKRLQGQECSLRGTR